MGAEQNLKVKIPKIFKELFEPYRFKAFYGGRGGGKSHAFATVLLLAAYTNKERILCAREIQKSIKDSVKRLLDDKIKELGLETEFNSTRDEIICPETGSLFVFHGLRHNVDSIKSLEGVTKCWVEEAHTVSQESMDILLPTIRIEGSEIWFSWNPKTNDDPVGNLFLKNNVPIGTIAKKVLWEDNPYFPGTLLKQLQYDKKNNYAKYQHIWEGKPVVHTEFQVFRNWRIDIFEPSREEVFYFGADWGFANDPTCLLRSWLDIGNHKIWIDQEAYGIGVEISDTPALFKQVDGSQEWPITADSARPEIISFMQKNGFPKIKKAIKGAGSVESGIKWLQDFEIIIHERCVNTINEFSTYRYKKNRLTGFPIPKVEDANNHLIDSLRYAYEEISKNKMELKPFFV